MVLHLHRAPRTDLLADALGELLATPLEDPFAQEVVVVPARGVERWLTQRLSHRLGTGARGGDGVCARACGSSSPSPWCRCCSAASATTPGIPTGWSGRCWRPSTPASASPGAPPCPSTSATAATVRPASCAATAATRSRSGWPTSSRRTPGSGPALVTDWREGRDTDGAGTPLPDDLAWQAELWRRMLARIQEEPPDVRHRRTLERLDAGGDGLDLPARLSLFGHTRLPATEVELLAALGRHRDVHLWLPQPSPALWEALSDLDGVVARDDDTSADRVGHPLLASLGRDSRELRRTLRTGGFPEGDLAGLPRDEPDTLLGWLQHDLRANHAPTVQERADRHLVDGDRSLQVHACHGAARQVDVLREVLVGLLQDDPTLEPRDILVMCPDIETFAPLVSAGFGLAPADGSGDSRAEVGHPAHLLRVRLADRALTSTNPLLQLAGRLLELSGGRVTASDVLDLATSAPCRRLFGFTDDDLDRLGRWVAATHVRWGLDAASRQRFSMERFPNNTWRAGLDRVLLGVAMGGDDHRHLGRGLPLDDVGSNEIDLAGRLAELLDRLGSCLAGLESATTVAEWMDALRRGVRDLAEVGGDDAWQLPQLERELARAAASSSVGGPELRLADVRALLGSRLAGRPTRANFRTGTLTVCTMVPMRSVPHRVVCLVGLDDGVFPRRDTVDGDDVLGRRPLTGERDPRSEDRQLFLDALLAATEHVVITYTGANESSGARRPPAVPLGELLDAADRTAAETVREAILTRHPLQPYDARNLKGPDPARDPAEWADLELRGPAQRPFSFDEAALDGAAAAWSVRRLPPPLLDGPLPDRPLEDVSLADLKAFLMHPVRSFLRGRLDVSTPFEPDQLGDAIPVDLNSLEVWQVGDHLLRQVLAGADPVAVMTAEQLGERLPPGVLGRTTLEKVAHECQQLWARTAEVRTGERRSLDVEVDLGGGRRLTGTVPDVYGNRVVSLGYSRLKAKQRLQTWVDVLALSASVPDESWTGHAIGRERAGPRRALTGPLDHRGARMAARPGRAARPGAHPAAADPRRHGCSVGRRPGPRADGAGRVSLRHGRA